VLRIGGESGGGVVSNRGTKSDRRQVRHKNPNPIQSQKNGSEKILFVFNKLRDAFGASLRIVNIDRFCNEVC
jgi:hypothetical protein